MYVYIYIYIYIYIIINNNNNKHFFNLQVANSPSRQRFEANLSRESSECTEHSKTRRVRLIQGRQSMWEMLD